MKQRPADGLYPLLVSQLEVLRAQMRSEDEGVRDAQAKTDGASGSSAGARDVLAALQATLARVTGGGDDEDDKGE